MSIVKTDYFQCAKPVSFVYSLKRSSSVTSDWTTCQSSLPGCQSIWRFPTSDFGELQSLARLCQDVGIGQRRIYEKGLLRQFDICVNNLANRQIGIQRHNILNSTFRGFRLCGIGNGERIPGEGTGRHPLVNGALFVELLLGMAHGPKIHEKCLQKPSFLRSLPA